MFTPDGQSVRVWGSFGTDPGQFSTPTSINFDQDGNVYVSEFRGHRVQIFTQDGRLIGEVAPGTFRGPHGLAFDSTGALYVADTGNDVIRKFERVETPG
ncbi:MAG: NHL repeat-containing protein [Chloroflexi bacterium]|nr:NHL repeat-containing protein [Chloroflexota bacterium]